ncbi:isoaspartyl peptidase/L-asparaginase [candidate division KSB1 bacterium]|nr:isoaspartyl peptidase/L-asparaginase [candidate division KSB1 bacterium]
MKEFALAVHGGAGVIPRNFADKIKQEYLDGLEEALKVGLVILQKGGASLDAVEATVKTLEDNLKFNAGKGSVFNHEGNHEMDASIMNGTDLSCGAVAGIRGVKNPIKLARLVMERTVHVALVGLGAEQFAQKMNVEFCDNDYFYSQLRYDQWTKAKERDSIRLDHSVDDDSQTKEKGTVGAVALDKNGNLAAATSTGGLTNKKYGRLSDSSQIGCGNYANNKTCAVSCTGTGEEFIRHVVAYDIHSQMFYKGLSLEQAAHNVVHQTLKPDDGGIIAVDNLGNIVFDYNSVGMFRAAADSENIYEVKIWE